MNKFLAWLPASLMIIGLAVYKPVKEAMKANMVDKSVSISVFRNADYNADAYKSTLASVYVTVEKINTKGESSILWEKNFDAKEITKYPLKEKALEQNISVKNINEHKERIEVKYVLIYNSKGTELQMQDETVITGRKTNVDIRI